MTIFNNDDDHECYLAFLRYLANKCAVAIHAYALMKNHVHLLATPDNQQALPSMMKRLGTRYVRYFNRRNSRCGTLWNERYRSILIEDDAYWLNCLRYIEQNPVRARVVENPEDYRWSTYRVHALGEDPVWLASHPVYESLGTNAVERQATYREICGASLSQFELIQQRFQNPKRSLVEIEHLDLDALTSGVSSSLNLGV